MNESNLISSAIEAFKEGREEAIRERKARQLDYQAKLIEKFNYSPKEFYVLLAKALEERRVPGLEAGLVKMVESVAGSARRLYMTVTRERFVYYICAAPYGSGFFFSWRLVDERRPGTWIDFLATFIFLAGLSGVLSVYLAAPFIRLLQSLNFDALSIAFLIPFTPLILFLMFSATLWSLMRCAALTGFERLAIQVEAIPFIGRVFERMFRPDTYFRQDSQKMYQKAFDSAINDAISSVTTPQGVRSAALDGMPAIADLHRR